jgi:hypothetical protein
MPTEIKKIESFGNLIKIEEMEQNEAKVTSTLYKSTFYLDITIEIPNSVRNWIEHKEMGKNTSTCVLSIIPTDITPKVVDDIKPKETEIVFFVDCSNSMKEGEVVKMVTNSIKILLKSLPRGVFFNIVTYNNEIRSLFNNESREYNKDSLEKAMKFVSEYKPTGSPKRKIKKLKSRNEKIV